MTACATNSCSIMVKLLNETIDNDHKHRRMGL